MKISKSILFILVEIEQHTEQRIYSYGYAVTLDCCLSEIRPHKPSFVMSDSSYNLYCLSVMVVVLNLGYIVMYIQCLLMLSSMGVGLS